MRYRRGGIRHRVGPPALHPQRDGGDAERHRDQHRAGQVGADADEAVRLDEQVEEEALVQVLKQVVQAAKQRLDRLAQAHLVVPPIPHGAQRDGVNVVRDERAVRPRRVAQPLAHHAPQHRAQPLLVRVPMVEHALDRDPNAHLARGDLHGRVEQVEVGQLAVDAVVLDVQLVVAVAPGPRGVVDRDGGLQRAALDVQALHVAGVVAVVVRVDPRLGTRGAVPRHEEDDVLAPQAPALEVAGQREHQRDARGVGLVVAVRPGADEHDGLCGVGTRALEDGVDVLAGDGAVRDVVGVLLGCDLEVVGTEDVGELRGASATYQYAASISIGGGSILLHRLLVQRPHLLAIGAEDIVLAAAKVRVHLARQQGVLGHVRLARVVVQRQDQQPGNADDDAQGGQVGRDLEDAGVAPERQQRGWPAVSWGLLLSEVGCCCEGEALTYQSHCCWRPLAVGCSCRWRWSSRCCIGMQVDAEELRLASAYTVHPCHVHADASKPTRRPCLTAARARPPPCRPSFEYLPAPTTALTPQVSPAPPRRAAEGKERNGHGLVHAAQPGAPALLHPAPAAGDAVAAAGHCRPVGRDHSAAVAQGVCAPRAGQDGPDAE